MNYVQIYTLVLYTAVLVAGYRDPVLYVAFALDTPLIGRVLGFW